MKKDDKFNQTVYKNAYNKKNYANCGLRIKPDIMAKIETFCAENGISKNSFFINSALYIIDNNISINKKD